MPQLPTPFEVTPALAANELPAQTLISITYFIGDETQTIPQWSRELTLEAFANHCLAEPRNCEGIKKMDYITRGQCFGSRCDANIPEASLLVIDGDSTEAEGSQSCIPIAEAHERLTKANVNHAIHTTASNYGEVNKWRAFIPCRMKNKYELEATAITFIDWINRGHEKPEQRIRFVREMKVWSQPWYMPSIKPDGKYQVFSHYTGVDLTAKEAQTPAVGEYVYTEGEPLYKAAIDSILSGSDIHTSRVTLGNYFGHQGASKSFTYNFIADLIQRSGREPHIIQARLDSLALTIDDCYANVAKHQQATAAVNQIKPLPEIEKAMPAPKVSADEKYTHLPRPGGVMLEIVKWVMSIQRYPNETIAIIVAEHLVSVFGGGHYHIQKNTSTRKRIMLAPLGTGKNSIVTATTSIVAALQQMNPDNVPYVMKVENFLGSDSFSFSTQHKQIEEHRVRSFVVNEAGESGKSQAGDMSNLKAYQLQALSTKAREAFLPKKFSEQGRNDSDKQMQTVYNGVWVYMHESTLSSYTNLLQDSGAFVNGDLSRSDMFFVNPHIDEHNINDDEGDEDEIVPARIRDIFAALANDFLRTDIISGITTGNPWESADITEIRQALRDQEVQTLRLRNQATEAEDEIAIALLGRRHERILTTILICALADATAGGVMTRPIARQHHLDYALRRAKAIDATVLFHARSGEFSDQYEAAVLQFIEKFRELFTKVGNLKKPQRRTLIDKLKLDVDPISGCWIISNTAVTNLVKNGAFDKLLKMNYGADPKTTRAKLMSYLETGAEIVTELTQDDGGRQVALKRPRWYLDVNVFGTAPADLIEKTRAEAVAAVAENKKSIEALASEPKVTPPAPKGSPNYVEP